MIMIMMMIIIITMMMLVMMRIDDDDESDGAVCVCYDLWLITPSVASHLSDHTIGIITFVNRVLCLV